MALKEHDLYRHQLEDLAEVLLAIQTGKCEPYVGAVVVVYRKYQVRDGRWHYKERVSARYRPYVYRLEDGKNARLRTVFLRKKTMWCSYSARMAAEQECRRLNGIMLEGDMRYSLHNLPLSVMAAGLNDIHIPGPTI